MEKMDRSAAFVPVLGMPTHIIQYGTISSDTDSIFLVIPGNPGVAEYYDHFMGHLYESSRGQVPVCAVSHAGHVTPEGGNTVMYNKLSYAICTLEGQIDHKIRFIEDNVPKKVKLFLIGHSIGCYIILKMLDQLKQNRHSVGRCFQLFPAIERFALSPNGRIFSPALKYLRWLGPILITALSWLPEGLKRWIIRKRLYCKGQDPPDCAYTATVCLLKAFPVSNALFMGNQQRQKVNTLDTRLLQTHLSCLSFYYGQTDGWCPKQYYSEMKEMFPNGDIRLCQNGHGHAFVISGKSNEDLAEIVWKWVQPYL